MTFQANIPLSTDLISVSQADILNNFQALSTSWQVNHVNFNSSGAGEHTQVSLIAPIADPNLASPKASLYTKASSTTITSDLYYQDGAIASNVKQLTGGGITAAAWVTFNNAGIIPAGGSYNVSSVGVAANVYTVNFPRNFSSATYVAVPAFDLSSSAPPYTCGLAVQSRAAASYAYKVLDSSGNPLAPTSTSIVFFGVLA